MNKKLFLIFLLLNFGALYIGTLLMGGSPAKNEWYQNLPKAPWTPPGWVFGLAWTIVMFMYSLFLSFQGAFSSWVVKFKLLYVVQFVLNITWNYVFFELHYVVIALIMLICLQFVMYLSWKQRTTNRLSWAILPYITWLFVAISLNSFPLVFNYINFV